METIFDSKKGKLTFRKLKVIYDNDSNSTTMNVFPELKLLKPEWGDDKRLTWFERTDDGINSDRLTALGFMIAMADDADK